VPPDISIDTQIKEVSWEIELRREVYARRVAAGKMTAIRAGEKIATMKAVIDSLEDYRRLLEAKL
jgi:hypothetical protein